jgi:hypothetical protein
VNDHVPVRRFYRVVGTSPPTRQDFLSAQALGRPLRANASEEHQRIFDGLSVSSTIEGARYTIERFPRLGAFIAMLDVPDDGRFRIEQTTLTVAHYTIWGDTVALLEFVTAVLPKEEEG